MYYAVIGTNYGDEGKGLAVDFLTLNGRNLGVRHNGGAQAGHTVEKEGKRFVFHELSSGSFNGADTYWAETFFPDLYKLEEEMREFKEASGKEAKIFASPRAAITLLYDVYLNQKKEESRGDQKHGSCGMGIWEATRRTQNGFGLTLGFISSESCEKIASRLYKIESDYMPARLEKFSIEEPLHLNVMEYAALLKDVCGRFITLVDDEKSFFESYDNVIFETGQGLLLDMTREEMWPHTTCSRTNISVPAGILERHGLKIDEAVYVTRTYLTRHGAGPFREDSTLTFVDATNVHNPWQDRIRYGRFESAAELIDRVTGDCKEDCPYQVKTSMFITHLNETEGKLLTCDGDVEITDLKNDAFDAGITKLYLSDSRFSRDVEIIV